MLTTNNNNRTLTPTTPTPASPRTAKSTVVQCLQASDLLQPFPARRGVRPHAADLLSRMERKGAYLPV